MNLSRFNIPDSEPDPIVAIIARRRRQVLVHSAIYYLYGNSFVDDATFDEWAQDLYELQQKYPDEAATAPYAQEFQGFVPSTGFDLPYKRPAIQLNAKQLLRERDKSQRPTP